MPAQRGTGRAVTAHFAWRGLRLWVVARLAVLLVLAMGDALAFTPGALGGSALLMVAICGGMGIADVARRGEWALLGNLGVRRARVVAWFALPALAGEAAFLALVAALASPAGR